MSLVGYHSIPDDVQTLWNSAVSPHSIVRQWVGDDGHVTWQWRRCQFVHGGYTVRDATTVVVGLTLIYWNRASVGNMCFLYVHQNHHEVGDVSVIGGHSTDVVEDLDERIEWWSDGAAEDEDEWP